MEISVVIPVYNSANIITELVRQLRDAITVEYELIFVNDASKDDSWNILSKLAESADVKALSLSMNFGQDNAIMAGLGVATGKYIVIMDDDLQHSPYDIMQLYDKCKKECDVCYADYSQHKKQTWWKNIGSFFNSKSAEVFLNKPNKIYISPYKIIKADIVKSMLQYQGAYPYIDGLIFRSTKSISQITVDHQSRYAGTGNYGLKKSISVFLKHATGFSIVPLRLASFIGFLISIFSFLLGLFYIFQYFSGNIIEGWTTLVVLTLFIGGMMLSSLGIIGEYIGRMYQTMNNRPQYIIRESKL
jgi:glycosyltransferase involved in cell wall biosynthesis